MLRYIFLFGLTLGSLPLIAFTKKDIAEWQIAPMPGISSFTKSGDMFYELPFRDDYYYSVEYHPNPTQGDLAFGDRRSLSAGMIKNQFIGDSFTQVLWADIEIDDNRLLFVDSWNYRIFFQDIKTKSFSRQGDIIIDKIQPAEDPRGPAPAAETASLRKLFKKRYKSLDYHSDGFLSMSRLSERRQKENDDAQFLVLTGIKSHPVVTMKCAFGGSPYCYYQHSCIGDKRLENSSAIFFHKKSDKILLIDKHTNNLKIFRFNSCFDITFDRELVFPKKIPKITDLTIDKNGYLWTSFKEKDQYNSAILVKWKKILKL